MKYQNLDELLEIVKENVHLFRDCSSGYRAKPALDGSFPQYHTLKYFAMPKALRDAVKGSVEDIDRNIETYLMMFKEGESMSTMKHIDRCFYINRGVVLEGEVQVTIDNKKHQLKAGDTIELELNKHHAVHPKTPCIFLLEMQIDKDFSKKRKGK